MQKRSMAELGSPNASRNALPALGRSHYRPRPEAGLGQLTLVEHALCPLDSRAALVRNLVFNTQFCFTDAQRHTQTADVNVFCPLGLCASDEFYLWGLLALTLAQSDSDGTLMATPHFMLRRLGLIDQHARRGGRQYRQFAAAMERLSAVKYQSNRFYDPIRGEHRRVSFGFLSFSLPLDDRSARAWRVVWDPVFFEFTRPLGGHLWFDLGTYRQLDPASRRLFLFACKVFSRRSSTPRMPLRHLGQSVLGFSGSLITRDLKAKVSRCISRLAEHRVINATEPTIEKVGRGEYCVTLERGPYFAGACSRRNPEAPDESPLGELLRAIGFDEPTIRRLLRQFPARILREWCDITLAARERFGGKFFKRSPQAYFIDSVRHAAEGSRTPPDWWHELRKAEERDRDRLPDEEQRVLLRIQGELSRKTESSNHHNDGKRGAAKAGRSSNAPVRLRSLLSL